MTLSDDEIDNILDCLKNTNIKDKSNLKKILKNYNKNKDIIKKNSEDDDEDINEEHIELDNKENDLELEENDLELEENDLELEENDLELEENDLDFQKVYNESENKIEDLLENDNNINQTKNQIDRLDDLIKETEEKIKNNIKDIHNLYNNSESMSERYESMSEKYKNFNFSDSYKSQFNHKLYKNKKEDNNSRFKSYLNRSDSKPELSDLSRNTYDNEVNDLNNNRNSYKYSNIYQNRYDNPYHPPYPSPHNSHIPPHSHPPSNHIPPHHQSYNYPPNYPPPPHPHPHSYESQHMYSNFEGQSQRHPFNNIYLNPYERKYRNNTSPLLQPIPPMQYNDGKNNILHNSKELDNEYDKGNYKTIVKDYVLLPGESNSKLIDLISQDLLNEIDGLKSEPLQPSEDKYSVKSLFEKFKEIKNKKMNISKYDKDELLYYDSLDIKEKDKIDKIEEKISKLNNIITPLRFRVLKSNIPLHNKAMIINKIEDLFSNKLMGGSEITKYSNWVNSLLKIPFKKYKKLPIDAINSSDKDIGNYLVDVKKTLDTAVYGHTNTKEQIIQIIAQWISNPSSTGNCIGIEGVMGNGKTTLVKNGIAKAIDRPFAFITLGGCSDSSFLEGHNYTYEGSMWGKIADILIQCKCMNPVFYFDELDKVSETPKGEEIINTLIHLTDSSQNSQFTDKYFNGVNLDLSKSLFIFSYNDKNKINPILLDRLICIKTDNFKTEDKIEIAKNYLLKDIFSQLTLDENKYKISDENLEYIIEKHTEEGGVRTLKKHLFSIFSKLNLLKLTKHDENIKYSFDLEKNLLEQDEIDKKIIDSLIKDGADKDDEYYKTFYM